MNQLSRTLDILRDLVAFPTVSADSNRALIAYAEDLLRDCGAQVDVMMAPCGTKANLFATIGPAGPGGILLSGHSDVVPTTDQNWQSDPFELTQRGARVYGRGTCDMKGFIAAVLAMAPRFAAQNLPHPIHIALTYDEEVGCIGAGHLVETLRARKISPRIAIIGEPTEMRVIEGHKGCYEYSTHFQGLEGHGSAPDQGVNAVEVAVQYVHHLLQLKTELRTLAPPNSGFSPPWTTVNIGAIHGGVAHNVIASKARVDWEMRPVQNTDADYVKHALTAFCDDVLLPQMRAIHPNTSIKTETKGEVAGLVPADENAARRIMMELTGAQTAELVAFGTEAGLFQSLGTDVVVCGPGSINQAHKADEFVEISQLEQCLDVLERLGGATDV